MDVMEIAAGFSCANADSAASSRSNILFIREDYTLSLCFGPRRKRPAILVVVNQSIAAFAQHRRLLRS